MTADLVAGLIHAARRTGLSRRTAEALRAVNFGLDVARQAPPAAILGAERINGFVSTLGFADVDEGQRPKARNAEGDTRAIFTRPAPADSADGLPQTPRATAQTYWTDWVYALDAVFEANAKDGAGGEIDVEQNLALGRILGALEGQGR